MRHRDPKLAALLLDEAIGRADSKGLEDLMMTDHSLVRCGSVDASGREASLQAWRGFFDTCPGYRNILAASAVEPMT